MVMARAWGTSSASIRAMTGSDTPFSSSACALRSMGCIISMKVKTSSASRNGGRISRRT